MEHFRSIPEGEHKPKSPEAGARPLGVSPPGPEQQAPQGGGSTSPERQTLPSVWGVLERKVRLHAPDVEGRPTGHEYYRELREVNRALDELDEKGTVCDGLIQELYITRTMEPTGTLPLPGRFRNLTLEEFQEFRTGVETLSEEEIREEIRRAKEAYERKRANLDSPVFPEGAARV